MRFWGDDDCSSLSLTPPSIPSTSPRPRGAGWQHKKLTKMATATLADMKWLARWNDPEVLFGDNTKYESDGGEGFDVGRFLILTVACHSFYWLVHFVSKATSTTYNGLKDASGRSTWCAYFASIVHGRYVSYPHRTTVPPTPAPPAPPPAPPAPDSPIPQLPNALIPHR